MTIAEAISRVDAQKHNTISQKQKIEWLSYLEGQIHTEIIDPGCTFKAFGSDIDPMIYELAAPHPYDEVYILYLISKIDLANQEITRYQNSKVLYNNAYALLRDWWTRNHMPARRVTHFKL